MERASLTEAVDSFRAYSRVHTRVAGVLAPKYMGTDLSLVEARLLYEIATRETVLATELQTVLGLDAGYASRLLRRFEERGWIVRGVGGDARQRPISATDAGRRAFDALDHATQAQTAELLEPLGDAGRAALVASLGTATALLTETAPEWRIRTFQPGDMGMIAARQAILYADGYGWGRPMEVLLCEVVTGFLRDFKPGREQCWVAERGGRMLGSVFVADAGSGVAQLRLLYVEAEARGLGIGRALVDECLRFARAAGYARMTLWTHTVLESARRIYAAAGFHLVDTSMHERFGDPVQGETWAIDLTPCEPRATA